MSELQAIVPKSHDYISIVWQVSNFCNYRCSYCNEYNWSGTFKNNDVENHKKVLSAIFKHYQSLGYNNFKIFYSGGEPTFWKPLIEICDFVLASNLGGVKFAINTNLSHSLDWWQKHYHYFDDVVASFHIESAKPDHYLKNAQFLQDKVNYLACRMMMLEERFDEVITFADRLKSSMDNYVLEYVPLFEELSNTTRPYIYKDPKKMEFFKQNSFENKRTTNVPPRSVVDTSSVEVYADGRNEPLNSNRLVAERKNFFKGWKCWIGDSLFINAVGEITAGTCGVLPPIGNINRGTIDFSNSIITCPKEQCHCGTDIYIKKMNKTYFAEKMLK